MVPRSAFTRYFQVSGLRTLAAAVLATGLVFSGSGRLRAQDVPPPPPDASQQDQQAPQDNQQLPQYGAPLPQDNSQQAPNSYPQEQQQAPAPQGQPLSADQLDQLVAPIALYPDALVAQVLAASTYPTQIVEADQWVQAQGNAPADQIAADANAQQWDPSVKALTAFPSVLSQMDRNMQWTTDLGNAYYNQPQDVMDAVQRMRQNARQAGSLESTQQQTVSEDDDGEVEIEPANPEVVYVPVYNPWVVYGPPIMAFPGYYYPPPPGIFFGVGFGFRIGFGWGIPIRPWAPWGWGWRSWGCGWYNRTVIYNRTTYITRSTTVINRGYNRPGSPPVQLAGQRGSFMNHAGYAGYANRVAMGARPAGNGYVYHAGSGAPGNLNRPVRQPTYNRTQPGYNRPAPPVNGYLNGNRPAPVYSGRGYAPPNSQRPGYVPSPTYNRPTYSAPTYRPSVPQNYSRPTYNAPTYRPPQNYSRPAPAPHYSAPRMESAPHYSAPRGGGEGGGGNHHR